MLAALAAAMCYAVGNVLQHATVQVAAAVPRERRRPSDLVRRVATSRRWLAGLLVLGVGTGLHVLALHLGRLFVVQPVVVGGMLVALPLSAAVTRRRQNWGQWRWAAAATVGLAAFLVAGHPRGAVTAVHPTALLGYCAAALAVTGMVVAAARRLLHRYRALLLGFAAGTLQGTEAALQKQVVGHGITHPLALLGWPLAALAVVSVTAVVLTQLAYAAGDLITSLPALSITNPLTAAALGAAAFGERVSAGPGAQLVEAAGIVLMVGGVLRLAALTADRHPGSTTDRSRADGRTTDISK